MIIMVIMLVFIVDFALKPLIEHSNQMNSPLNALEPFIAIGNSNLLMIMMPAVFLVLISDFPRTDGNTLFFITRTGKLNWLIGQIVFALLAVFTFVSIVFIVTLLPMLIIGFWDNWWSLVVTKYAMLFPENSQDFASSLITKNLYNQVAPFSTAIHIFFFTSAYLFVITLINLFFNTIKVKILGVLFAGSIIAFGGALCLVNSSLMWILPMAHTKISLHYTEYFREQIYPMWNRIFILELLLF